ncbi:MAG: inositol monophosphatase [Gammaproteobacteria bacterium]|nr:inositol monophosphatase [Gammaproteobacteria bacterium]
MLNSNDLPRLVQLIRTVARQELLPRFRQVQAHLKLDGSVVTAADLAMQQQLTIRLATAWPQIALLGEEMPVQQQQALFAQQRAGLWIVDPLDGTSNFSCGVPCFAVSVALLVENKIEMAVVYDPLLDEVFSAVRGRGAWLNDQPLHLAKQTHPEAIQLAIVDFKRLPAPLAAQLVSAPPYRSQRSFGSVALDWCWIAAGRAQVYVHGKQQLWDFAAGSLILEEAGGYACSLQGEPVFQGGLESRSAVLAVTQAHFILWRRVLGVASR